MPCVNLSREAHYPSSAPFFYSGNNLDISSPLVIIFESCKEFDGSNKNLSDIP